MCVSAKRCFRLRARSTRWNNGDGVKVLDIAVGQSVVRGQGIGRIGPIGLMLLATDY
jgi:hypothetical protein